MKKSILRAVLPVAALFFLAYSCDPSGQEPEPIVNDAGITILEAAEVNSNSAVLKLSFKASSTPSRVSLSFRCACVDIASYAQASGLEADAIIAALSESGIEGTLDFSAAPSITATFRGLSSDTQYLAAAVVSYGPLNIYSNVFEFRTTEGGDGPSGDEPDNDAPASWEMPPAIDLGLPSGKGWAAFDLGAGTLADYGNYFAWGETAPKPIDQFIWSNYKWCQGTQSSLTKYCHDGNFGYNGFFDDLTALDPQDDAASVLLNEDWSIPTCQDFEELMSFCDYRKGEVNGVLGMIFTSRINGNAIFFPLGGFVEDGVLRAFKKEGLWWCNSFYNFDVIGNGPYTAFVATVPGDYDDIFYPNDGCSRSYGVNIRPVCSKPADYPASNTVESIEFNEFSASMCVGEFMTLKVTIGPVSASLTPIVWESSNSAVASVEYGKITALAEGTATITATAGGKSATCELTVSPSKVCTTQAVDLGLSVKWAGWNIGAAEPQEYGKFFAWGETTAWALGWSGVASYRFYDSNSPASSPKFTKYVTSDAYATDSQYVDGLSKLLPEDDAATAAWGEDWRMPTDEEKTEFLANTTHERYEYKGIKGYLFTSVKNGNAIFLPCTGMKIQGSNPAEEEYLCGFWTSSLNSDNSMAYIACNKVEGTGVLPDSGFEMDPTAQSWHLSQYRWYGLPVRAVTSK